MPYRRGGAIDNRAVELLVGCVQCEQQFEHLVADFVQARIRTVDLIDNNDNLMTEFKRLLQHETGLRHPTFRRVYKQDDAVYHLKDTLDLTGEVRMPRSINDVDLGVVILHRSILRQNRNSALTLDIARIHHVSTT